MTKEEFEMRTLVRESDVIDRTDGSELAKAFNYLWEKYVEQEPCEDAISRQALLEEIKNGIKAGNYEEGYEEYSHINDMDDIIECIKYADSIQPKPKTGHWIPDDTICEDTLYRCSNCDNVYYSDYGDIKDMGYNYCPNCGCQMLEG